MLLKTSGDTPFTIRGPTHANPGKEDPAGRLTEGPQVALGAPVGSSTHHALLSAVSSGWGRAHCQVHSVSTRAGSHIPHLPPMQGERGWDGPQGPCLGEGVPWLLGLSRPWADADETAGDSTRGTAARPAVSRVGGTGPGFSGKAGGCCLKSESEACRDRVSSASFGQRPGQHSTDVSACRGPQLPPDPGLMRAGLLQGGGLPAEAGGGPGLAHQWYRGNLPCRAGPGEAPTLLPHGQRAGPGPGAGGRWSFLVRTEVGPCELVPPLSTDPHLPSSPGGHWAGPGLKRTQRRAVGTHQHFDRHDPWFLVRVMKLGNSWSATQVSSALTDRLHHCAERDSARSWAGASRGETRSR